MTYADLLPVFIINYLIYTFTLNIILKRNSWYDSFFIIVVHMTLGILLEDIIKNEYLNPFISIIITAILYLKVFLPITYPKKADNHESDTINE